MKVSELWKLLKKDGWFIHREGHKHTLLHHPTKAGQIALPRHGSQEVATGTANAILKQAGLK